MSKCKYVFRSVTCAYDYVEGRKSAMRHYRNHYHGGYTVNSSANGTVVSSIMIDGNVVVTPREMHLFKKVGIDHTSDMKVQSKLYQKIAPYLSENDEPVKVSVIDKIAKFFYTDCISLFSLVLILSTLSTLHTVVSLSFHWMWAIPFVMVFGKLSDKMQNYLLSDDRTITNKILTVLMSVSIVLWFIL